MKKSWLLAAALVVLALYAGMALERPHPMEQLFNNTIEEINHVQKVNFKSGFAITRYSGEEVAEQWQMKREGTYDVWHKQLNFRNVEQFSHLGEEKQEEVEKKTSLSQEAEGNFILLPEEEVFFKKGTCLTKEREGQKWVQTARETYDLLELLPFHAELLNRYAKYYASDNRGKFVVFFFSVDPSYLTENFPGILQAYGHDFPARFQEGTIKLLVYPDTFIPRRVYSIFRVTNLETGDLYEFNIDTYFSEEV